MKTQQLEHGEPIDLPDDFSFDPSDITDGEVVCNAKRMRRVVCANYYANSGRGRLMILYVDHDTGLGYEVSTEEWLEWAGQKLWRIVRSAGGWDVVLSSKSPIDPQEESEAEGADLG